MLTILFSPSEGKNKGGNETKKELFGSDKARDEILNAYNQLITKKDTNELEKLFGIKNKNEYEPYLSGLDNSQLMCAIERYSGVAYEYLAFETLDKDAQTYLRKYVLIFSNLYGPLLGGDTIANYKVHQGVAIADIAPEKYYKDRFSYQLDLYLSDKEILDLRAGYYEKFYKTVSHWAKAYRGIVLREIAKHNICSLEEFHKLDIQGLHVKEILSIKNKTEIVFNIGE